MLRSSLDELAKFSPEEAEVALGAKVRLENTRGFLVW